MGTNATVSNPYRWNARRLRSTDHAPGHQTPGNQSPDRLVGRYVIGLAAIALLAITSSLVVGRALNRQESDARVVNAAAGQVISSFELEKAGAGLVRSESAGERETFSQPWSRRRIIWFVPISA